MSADNYMLVRRVGDRFLVTNESASAEVCSPVDNNHGTWYDDELTAIKAADSQYSEYGVQIETDGDHSGDTVSQRLLTRAHGLDYRPLYTEYDVAAGKITTALKGFNLTVEAVDGETNMEDVFELRDWVIATLPHNIVKAFG